MASMVEHVVVMDNLQKVYGCPWRRVVAVDRVSIDIHRGECFGLVGVNGAGMTTLIKMLIGEIPMTSGNAYVHGYPVKSNIAQVSQCMRVISVERIQYDCRLSETGR